MTTDLPTSTSRFWFIVPAAGIGQRMQTDRPKQYLPLANTTVLEQTLTTLLSVDNLEGIVVAIHPEDDVWSQLALSQHKNIHTVIGGAERCDSVLAALNYLQGQVSDMDWVLVHDAARPCILPETITSMLDELGNDPVGGILGVASSDTLKRVDADQTIQETVDRECIWRAQTPQMFRYHILQSSLAQAIDTQCAITDEAFVVEKKGYSVKMVSGRQDNIKITHPDDLWLAEAILARQRIKES